MSPFKIWRVYETGLPFLVTPFVWLFAVLVIVILSLRPGMFWKTWVRQWISNFWVKLQMPQNSAATCLNVPQYTCNMYIAFFRSISRRDLVEYVSNHYKAPRMVLSAAGGVEHNKLVDLAHQHFDGLSATYTGEIPVLPQARFTGSEVRGGCRLSDPHQS